MFIFKMFQFSQIYWAFLLLAFFVGSWEREPLLNRKKNAAFS